MGSLCDKEATKASELLCSECVYLNNKLKALKDELDSYKLIMEHRDRRIQLLESHLMLYDKYY
jgi:hypothetical protein